MHPPPPPLPQRPLIERGKPQRRHQLAAGELGEQTRVDLVGLRGQRRHGLDLARIGDLHLPAAIDELVAHPERAAHHLQARLHLSAQFEDEPSEPVPGSGYLTLASDLTAGSECAPLRLSVRAQSIPTYSTSGLLPDGIGHRRVSPARRPFFMTFHKCSTSSAAHSEAAMRPRHADSSAATAARAWSRSRSAPFRPYWWRSPPGISIRTASATPPAFNGSKPAAWISRSIVVAAASSSVA